MWYNERVEIFFDFYGSFKMTLKEFFGFGGYERSAEGYMSWQHLLFVSILVVIMATGAIVFGIRYRNRDFKEKNRVLMISAILIDAFELFKIVILCIRHGDAFFWVNVLPLFLCSIQLITIPLAAFSRVRVKEAALDFITIFGMLCAILGTYCAGNNYAVYPVISFDNVVSGITHVIAGFCALYIMISGMTDMKKKNIPVTVGILGGFCIAAYIANIFTDCNYMFLSRGDGTPYDIVFNWVSGNQILYPILVVALFVVYIAAFYQVYYLIASRARRRQECQASTEESRVETTV